MKAFLFFESQRQNHPIIRREIELCKSRIKDIENKLRISAVLGEISDSELIYERNNINLKIKLLEEMIG